MDAVLLNILYMMVVSKIDCFIDFYWHLLCSLWLVPRTIPSSIGGLLPYLSFSQMPG